jgi:hypothetical protein
MLATRGHQFHSRAVIAFQQLEQLPGDRSLQAPANITGALALGPSPDGVGAGGWVVAQPGHHHGVQRPVVVIPSGSEE